MTFVRKRTKLPIHYRTDAVVKGHEFIRRVKQYGRRYSNLVQLVQERGKGSHITLYLGDRRTIVKDRKKETGSGLYRAMLRQLDIQGEI